jgi:hypothetical protein
MICGRRSSVCRSGSKSMAGRPQIYCVNRYADYGHTWFLVKEHLQSHAQLRIRIRDKDTHNNACLISGCPGGEVDKNVASPLRTLLHKTLSSTSTMQPIFPWANDPLFYGTERLLVYGMNGLYSKHFPPLVCRISRTMHNR